MGSKRFSVGVCQKETYVMKFWLHKRPRNRADEDTEKVCSCFDLFHITNLESTDNLSFVKLLFSSRFWAQTILIQCLERNDRRQS